MAVKRALTFKDIKAAKVDVFEFEGNWLAAFGKPQSYGIWYIFGGSGSGKTSFVIQLIKYLAGFKKVFFVPYEDGNVSLSLQENTNRFGLDNLGNKVLVRTDSAKELEERLKMRNSPDVVVIDSLMRSEFRNIEDLLAFTDKFPKKLFVFIGHAKGEVTRNEFEENVLRVANQKIFVKNYRAFCRGRSFGELGYYTVWEKGARDMWEYK